MTNFPIEELSNSDLVAALERVAISYGQALEGGNSNLTNKAHDEAEAIYRELEVRGASATSLMIPLLSADQDWIRYVAAAYALDFDPVRAKPVLLELKKAPKALGMMAYTTLKNWEMKNPQVQ